jgi:hypothetical protein
MNLFKTNVNLASSYFYALSGICFANKINSEQIFKSPGMLKQSIEMIKENIKLPELTENVCSMLSNLTYKNEQHKIVLYCKLIQAIRRGRRNGNFNENI